MEHKQTILAVGAHIGDMELTAGMLLATCASQGGSIATLALTAGEKGAPAGADVAAYRKQKVSEAQEFARRLGGSAYVLDYPDGLLPDSDEARFAVCDIIREVKPDILITHHRCSMHKDHALCRRIVEDARFYAGIAMYIWMSARGTSFGSRRSRRTGSLCTARASRIWSTTTRSAGCGASRRAPSGRNVS